MRDLSARVLIIDDHPTNILLLTEILRDHGYRETFSITDPRLALETTRVFLPDLILLDWMMPYMDGEEVITIIRAAWHPLIGPPIVVITADITERTKLRALSLGASDFLTKPFDAVDVMVRVRNLLEIRRLRAHFDREVVGPVSRPGEADPEAVGPVSRPGAGERS